MILNKNWTLGVHLPPPWGSIHVYYHNTHEPLYNTVHYNTVLDINNTDLCWIPIRLFLLYVYTFYSRYNADGVANMEIGLDPSNSVIKRLRCIPYETVWPIKAKFFMKHL